MISVSLRGIKNWPNRIDTEFVYNDIPSHWNVLSRAWVGNTAITRSHLLSYVEDRVVVVDNKALCADLERAARCKQIKL